MPLLQHEQRVQSDVFEQPGVEQRQVQAGAEPVAEHLLGRAHLLPLLFEARRRVDVGDARRDDRVVHGREHRLGARRLAAVVAVERARTGRRLQPVGDGLQQRRHRRVVR
ncbi:MAG: hypothetical protein H6838_09470 [Planctomycetes bacterium]|nr:hypothetical protein [Planctomycetota bacterium]